MKWQYFHLRFINKLMFFYFLCDLHLRMPWAISNYLPMYGLETVVCLDWQLEADQSGKWQEKNEWTGSFPLHWMNIITHSYCLNLWNDWLNHAKPMKRNQAKTASHGHLDTPLQERPWRWVGVYFRRLNKPELLTQNATSTFFSLFQFCV